jgi:uncharacterized protein (DUF427 family)
MKSPGHQQNPNHKVEEEAVAGKMKVSAGEHEIASSDDVIAVHEDGCPTRFYFPRSAVPNQWLQRSSTTSHCPFKGTAHYFNLALDGETLQDAVWSYEEPYDEHLALKDRLAFYDDKLPQIHVAPA